jgi:hypothetical protein
MIIVGWSSIDGILDFHKVSASIKGYSNIYLLRSSSAKRVYTLDKEQ